MSEQRGSNNGKINDQWYARLARRFAVLGSSVYRNTIQYFKNIPSKIIHFFRIRINEKKRMPKRNTPNRIYVLVGYTTQAHIDRKFRREKAIHITRTVLIIGVFLMILLLSIRSLKPFVESFQYKQLLGIENIQEMTQNDPFQKDTNNNVMTFSTESESSEFSP